MKIKCGSDIRSQIDLEVTSRQDKKESSADVGQKQLRKTWGIKLEMMYKIVVKLLMRYAKYLFVWE